MKSLIIIFPPNNSTGDVPSLGVCLGVLFVVGLIVFCIFYTTRIKP